MSTVIAEGPAFDPPFIHFVCFSPFYAA